MISQMRFGTFFFALTAWCWCLAGASAQEQRAPPEFDEEDPSANVAKVTNFPWDTIQWIERRYKVEAVRFKARDESGVDWLGSDEVIIGTYDAKGSTVSEEIGDIDSGDTHQFDPATSCIIAVRPGEVVLGQSSVCNDVGEPAPFGFRVEFWEKDNGLPGGFCAPLQPPPGGHAPPHCLNDNFDDFIGTAHLHFSARDLDAVLPNVGDEYVETTKLVLCQLSISG